MSWRYSVYPGTLVYPKGSIFMDCQTMKLSPASSTSTAARCMERPGQTTTMRRIATVPLDPLGLRWNAYIQTVLCGIQPYYLQILDVPNIFISCTIWRLPIPPSFIKSCQQIAVCLRLSRFNYFKTKTPISLILTARQISIKVTYRNHR